MSFGVRALGRAGIVVAAGLLAPVVPLRAQRAAAQAVTPAAAVPRTILARGELLAEMRRQVLAGDPSVRPAWAALMKDAEAAMTMQPVSVTQKRLLPPSGDRHDFMSFAPYWWPDSTKPDGLPYVRRDGVVNPQSRLDHDGWRMYAMTEAVEALALAHYVTGERRYAERAAELLRVFFLDSATRMNPHLEYAQAIPGVTPGRGIGILDSRHLVPLVDALRLLERSPAYTAADREGMRRWLRAYLDWMLTSKNGKDERAAENNHGTFYDMQVVALGLFLGDTAFVRRTLTESTMARLAAHVKPDGSQPLELERTRPLHYSLFNLEAFTALAEMARQVGVDLWRHVTPQGASLSAALRYVAPYADSTRKWPTTQVTPAGAEVFLLPLRRGAYALDDQALAHAAAKLPEPLRTRERLRLVLPVATPAVRPTAAQVDSAARTALAFAAAQVRRAATALDPANGWPRTTRADGTWEQVPARQWTSGFFPGTLWYLFRATGDTTFRAQARRWTTGLEPLKTVTTTHDLGFLLYDSFGHGWLLTRDSAYRDVALTAARSLATRYSPVVGATKSWDVGGAGDPRASWKYPVIVDNLMNLELLFWAARESGDTALRAMAERHALTSARAHLRPDGSTAHVALFDPATGALERTVTWQGHADSSTWARGQAWAIHGFTTAYGYTRNPALRRAAERAADWFVAHMPADAVPFWDFRHPAIPVVERDASASAIAASGLYDLARRTDAARARRYRAAADRLVYALARDYRAAPSPSGAVLRHSVGQRPQGVEVDVGITYADYYFVEALLRRRGVWLP